LITPANNRGQVIMSVTQNSSAEIFDIQTGEPLQAPPAADAPTRPHMPFHKRHHRAEFDRTRGLTLEEFGALVRLTDLMYERNGDVPDDIRSISGRLNCDVRVGKRLRERLIATGHLYRAGDFLRNSVVDPTIGDYQAGVAARVDARKQKALEKKGATSGLATAQLSDSYGTAKR
jgi:Protein of unknown function (DUF1376)